MGPPGKRKLSCAKTNRWFYDEINWLLACFSGVRCCTSGLTSGMKPIQRRWSSWLMPRKSSIWQHSGAMEQRHRLTDRTFGGISRVRETQYTYLIVYCTTKLIWKLQSITPTLQVLHVFALMHLLGFAFAPNIQDFHDNRLFIHGIS